MEDRLSQKSTNFTQEANFTRRAQAGGNFGIRAAGKVSGYKILKTLLGKNRIFLRITSIAHLSLQFH